jgi:hypothetical protein
MVRAAAASDPGNARRSVDSPFDCSVLPRDGGGVSTTRGRGGRAAEDAVVIITGLMPGMKLSTGSAFGGDAWQVACNGLALRLDCSTRRFCRSCCHSCRVALIR